MTQRKIRWLKRLAKAAGIAAAVIAVLAVTGQWWLAPALLRWRISRLLPEYWDGFVFIPVKRPVDVAH